MSKSQKGKKKGGAAPPSSSSSGSGSGGNAIEAALWAAVKQDDVETLTELLFSAVPDETPQTSPDHHEDHESEGATSVLLIPKPSAKKWLQTPSASRSSKQGKSQLLLSYAVDSGASEELIELLLRAGASSTTKEESSGRGNNTKKGQDNSNSSNAFLNACWEENESLLSLFLKHNTNKTSATNAGINFSAADGTKQNAFHILLSSPSSTGVLRLFFSHPHSPLQLKHKQEEQKEEGSETKQGEQWNLAAIDLCLHLLDMEDTNGLTPLLIAAQNAHTEPAQYIFQLLQQWHQVADGASVREKVERVVTHVSAKRGDTCLHLFLSNERNEILTAIITPSDVKGSDEEKDAERAENEKQNALASAVDYLRFFIVEMGVDPFLLNHKNQSVIFVFIQNNSWGQGNPTAATSGSSNRTNVHADRLYENLLSLMSTEGPNGDKEVKSKWENILSAVDTDSGLALVHLCIAKKNAAALDLLTKHLQNNSRNNSALTIDFQSCYGNILTLDGITTTELLASQLSHQGGPSSLQQVVQLLADTLRVVKKEELEEMVRELLAIQEQQQQQQQQAEEEEEKKEDAKERKEADSENNDANKNEEEEGDGEEGKKQSVTRPQKKSGGGVGSGGLSRAQLAKRNHHKGRRDPPQSQSQQQQQQQQMQKEPSAVAEALLHRRGPLHDQGKKSGGGGGSGGLSSSKNAMYVKAFMVVAVAGILLIALSVVTQAPAAPTQG